MCSVMCVNACACAGVMMCVQMGEREGEDGLGGGKDNVGVCFVYGSVCCVREGTEDE